MLEADVINANYVVESLAFNSEGDIVCCALKDVAKKSISGMNEG